MHLERDLPPINADSAQIADLLEILFRNAAEALDLADLHPHDVVRAAGVRARDVESFAAQAAVQERIRTALGLAG
jgi:hypothetical protein